MTDVEHSKRASSSTAEKRDEVFLEEARPQAYNEPPPPDFTIEQEKRLYRKIDIRLMPMLTLMYLVSFLDRGEANYRLGFLGVLTF